MRAQIILIGYNRPAATLRTIRSLDRALSSAMTHNTGAIEPMIRAVIDGPKGVAAHGDRAHGDESKHGDESEKVERVAAIIRQGIPHVAITTHARNRGLPTVLLEALDGAFARPEVDRVICVEDDVDLSPVALSALLYASERMPSPHVIAAAPLRDGIPPNQCLLLTRDAHLASRPLLERFISTFNLDGAYGTRDHAAIRTWSAAIAYEGGVSSSPATSQDAIRTLAWRLEGVSIHALPMRLVAHRGLRGQHNTPLHALRTGAVFERLDRRPWGLLQPRLDAWISRGGGIEVIELHALERFFAALARSAYDLLRFVRRQR
jgi:hypothetical protein